MAGRMHAHPAQYGTYASSRADRCSVANYEPVVMSSLRSSPRAFRSTRSLRATLVAALGLGLAVLLRPTRLVYIAIIAVAIALIGLYAYNVAVGLPFGDQHATTADGREQSESAGHGADGDEEGADAGSGHHDEGLVVGSGEPIDAIGATTKLREIAGIGLAIALLRRRPLSRP